VTLGIAETIMHLLISTIIVGVFTWLVIVGLLKVIADLLATDAHRPPSMSDKYFQDELEAEDSDRQRPSSYSVGTQRRRMSGATDLRTVR
jgi:hypothetical protein